MYQLHPCPVVLVTELAIVRRGVKVRNSVVSMRNSKVPTLGVLRRERDISDILVFKVRTDV